VDVRRQTVDNTLVLRAWLQPSSVLRAGVLGISLIIGAMAVGNSYLARRSDSRISPPGNVF